MLLPHHDGSPDYVPNQAPDLGERVPLFVRVPLGTDVAAMHMRSVVDGEEMWSEAVVDRHTDTDVWWRVETVAHNPVTPYRFRIDAADGATRWLTAEGIYDWEVPDRHDFRLVTFAPPPSWAARTAWYQIFPDRFAAPTSPAGDGPIPEWATLAKWEEPPAREHAAAMAQLYGGSLAGAAGRVDHLVELGVNGVWTTPFFPAHSNHRYNADSFEHVDPVLGGDDALVELVSALHQAGIRIIGDLTTNHTGRTHAWFTDEPSFYVQDAAGDTVYWLGVRSLPKLDHGSERLAERLHKGQESVVARWLRPPFELDGWRIDVANMTGRYAAVDVNARVASELRRTMTEANSEALLLAEHAHDASGDLDGSGWHGTMNYAGFTMPVWRWLQGPAFAGEAIGRGLPEPRRSGRDAAATMRAFMAAAPWRSAVHNLNLLGSHDTARWATVAGDPERSRVGAGLLFTYPGMPCVFAGDEIGMRGADSLTARTPFPWGDRSRWDVGLLGYYRELARLRTSSEALAVGSMRWVSVGEDHMVFLRELGDERILVHAARDAHATVRIDPNVFGFAEWKTVAGVPADKNGSGELELTADGPTFRALALELSRNE